MKGTFSRVSPASFAEKVGIPAGWIVISHRWVSEKAERRRTSGRWFKITSANGSVFRILRFSPNLKGVPGWDSAEIVLDWPAWLELTGFAEDVSEPIELSFRRASWWQFAQLAESHPDPTYRMAGRLAVISVVLGVVSLVLSVIPLFK